MELSVPDTSTCSSVTLLDKWPHVVLSTKSYNHLNHIILFFWPHPSGSWMVTKPKVAIKRWNTWDGAEGVGGGRWGEAWREMGWRRSLHWRSRNTMMDDGICSHRTQKQEVDLEVSRELWCLSAEKRRQGSLVPRTAGPGRVPSSLLCFSFTEGTEVWSDYWEDFLGCFLSPSSQKPPAPKKLRLFLSCNESKSYNPVLKGL